MSTNPIPHYYAIPRRYNEQHGYGKSGQVMPHWFEIRERRGKEDSHTFFLTNRGPDRLAQLLARGIPADNAREVFYQIDSK